MNATTPLRGATLATLAIALALATAASPAQTRTSTPQRAAPPAGCPDGWKPVPPELNSALRCLPDNFTVGLAPGAEAPPPGCPAGWQPVSPGVNPILRCQPSNLAPVRTGGTAAPPPGCPSGWKPAPQGMNPALRCVPDNLVIKTRPGAAAPPPGCPSGWKHVAPGVNPVLGCQPGQVTSGAQPQADRDPGGPIQAGLDRDRGGPPPGDRDPGGPIQMKAVVAQADLALMGEFGLGDQSIPWGTEATVQASSAAFKRVGRCGFRYVYRTRNAGPVASLATANRILRDTQTGDLLATKAMPALASGEVAVSDGHVSLAPGTWMLYVHADAPGNVAESDETNNLRRVRVTVDGSCD